MATVCRLHKPGFQNFGSWSERGGGAATAGGTAPCARSGRPPDLLWPAPGTYARACAKRCGRPRPRAAAKNAQHARAAFAARGYEGLATVREGASAPARCAAALCTWLPAQRPCSGGRAAPRCVMGTPGVRGRPKRGAGRWAAPRRGRAPGAGRRVRKCSGAVLASFLPAPVWVCAGANACCVYRCAGAANHALFSHV